MAAPAAAGSGAGVEEVGAEEAGRRYSHETTSRRQYMSLSTWVLQARSLTAVDLVATATSRRVEA